MWLAVLWLFKSSKGRRHGTTIWQLFDFLPEKRGLQFVVSSNEISSSKFHFNLVINMDKFPAQRYHPKSAGKAKAARWTGSMAVWSPISRVGWRCIIMRCSFCTLIAEVSRNELRIRSSLSSKPQHCVQERRTAQRINLWTFIVP